MKLNVGDTAPNFTLMGDDYQMHTLAELKGPSVIFFYPKDNTPGCTTESCDFRDNMLDIVKLTARVYGISRDSIGSHQKFKEKYTLNFPLLSDPDLAVHQAYGVLNNGRTIRSTFLIDKSGRIAKIWSPVKVPGHVHEVLQALRDIA